MEDLMHKSVFTLFLFLFSFSVGYSQLTTLWEKSSAAGTKPVWDAGNLTRGISYGFVQSQHLLFVANRHSTVGGKMVVYYNAQTGDSLGVLNVSALTGGTYAINDIEVSEDGKIFLGNLSVNAANDNFKVYRYDSLSAEPVLVISYNATPERLGDKITVTGKCSDNSIIIWAAISQSTQAPGNLYKFSTTDNGISFTPTSVVVPIVHYTPSVGPVPNGNFYFDSHTTLPTKHSPDGSLLGKMPVPLLPSSGGAIRFLDYFAGDEYVLAFEVWPNNAKILRVPAGIADSAVTYLETPLLGNNSAEGIGDVSARKVDNFIHDIFVLAANNGFGAYRVDFNGSISNSEELEVNTFVPTEFSLNQNYPNPFNPSTKIVYSLPVKTLVTINVFDALGMEIKTLIDEEKSAGIYEIKWNAGNLPSGVYFYQLKAGDYLSTKKMIFIK
jgi:hypothetical protein